jgi:NAD+ synthase
MKLHLSQLNPTVGDLDGNAEKILREFQLASEAGYDLAVFSEMILTGYPCEDLWQKKDFISAVRDKISEICEVTTRSKCAILFGAPTIDFNKNKTEIIRNSALLIEQGEVKKIINKKSLPNFGVFDESRYFEASSFLSLVNFRGLNLAILICEDLWDSKNLFLLQEQILDGVIVLNASPYSAKKLEKRLEKAELFAKNLGKFLVYVNQVGGQDSLVFDGGSFVLDSEGKVALQMKEFEEDSAVVDVVECETDVGATLVVARGLAQGQPLQCETNRDYSACLLALRDYVHKNNFTRVILGMSGGIDSALVATMAVDALGAENVLLYALPSRFNPDSSMNDAKTCAKNLGVNLEIISIEPTFEAMMASLGNISELAQENLQARIRGNILMAISNTSGALLLSTGNKSELAMGYATLYGDMCGGFNPLKDLYKTQVYELAKLRADVIPQNIFTKAPSAELRPDQKDSDSLPDYEILDKILFALIEEKKSVAEVAKNFDESLVKKVAKVFYASEYKRRQSCLGPKISEMAFDKDRRFPITNKF